MSRSNVEIALTSFRLFDEGDFERVEPLWAHQVRVSAPEGWPEPGPVEGRDAAMRQFERLRADASESKIEPEVLKAEGEWVVVSFQWRFTGAGSGLETVMDGAVAFRIQDDVIAEAHYRWRPEDALEAAGFAN